MSGYGNVMPSTAAFTGYITKLPSADAIELSNKVTQSGTIKVSGDVTTTPAS